ncbi:MAG: hypothetical protein JW819_05310 [Candidatus Krumholzibacteriota bacterium]|nr:hypothetical protein [Candidatus Krumholzibacteriota bacterium]
MKSTRWLTALLLAAALGLTACSLLAPDEEALAPPPVQPGTADFSVFVALGNSLTAGVQSGALYESAQQRSWAALLAAAMDTGFELPLIADPGYFNWVDPVGHLAVSFDSTGEAGIDPVPWSAGEPALLNAALPLPYHDLGIPGALAWDLLNARGADDCFSALFGGSPNPYFDVILRNDDIDWTAAGAAEADLTPLAQAALLSPTFLAVWIGNNEILGAATRGDGTPLVSPDDFAGLYTGLLDAIAATMPGADVIAANVPPVACCPFFTTIPWLVVDGDHVPVLDGAGLPIGLLSAEVGQLVAGDRVLLTAKDYMEDGMGIPDAVLVGFLMAELGVDSLTAVGVLTGPATPFPRHGQPLPESLTLTASELDDLAGAVLAYNTVIDTLAAARSIPVVDIHALLARGAAEGLVHNGQLLTAELVTGGLFSLDGVHPADLGHAVVAEAFARVINETWSARLRVPEQPLLP